ncbi:MAG: polymorphic toxin type 23 domain-containing protein [Bacteroidia bacterium]|nr:polymorphic toxin type 23 domain-containing protein [Bacteroidia bacterium]
MKRVVCLIFLIGEFFPVSGQWIQSERLGGTVGLSVQLGTTINRLGISANGYYLSDFVQVNLQLRGFYSFTDLGARPAIPGWEAQISAGGVLGFGPDRQTDGPFLSPVSNQTGRQYALAYAYNLYFDQRGTSQRTATVAFHIGKFLAASENDALSGELADKFRTASLLFLYRVDSLSIGLNTLMWTGDSRDPKVKKIRQSEYPGRFGYKDLRDVLYGRFSHGIQTVQAQYALPYGQVTQANVGVDSEYVRHFLQNRLIHDLRFVPLKWNKSKNPHYPMLDTEGLPYLYLPGQKVKPSRLYFNVGMNPGLFY